MGVPRAHAGATVMLTTRGAGATAIAGATAGAGAVARTAEHMVCKCPHIESKPMDLIGTSEAY